MDIICKILSKQQFSFLIFQLVVKCEPDEKHPMGFLHTSFVCGENIVTTSDTSHMTQFRFGCDCQKTNMNTPACSTTRKRSSVSAVVNDIPNLTLYPSNSPTAKRCIHFYSCLAVFLSDVNLSKEFSR